MRCALRYDEDQLFADQKVEAWGELQSLSEEPCYKETELNKANAKYFYAYKCGIDDAIGDFTCLIDEDEESVEHFKDLCAGSVCEMLFSLLDEQEE